ncbi:DUF1540 domain-containing protein [Sporomusa sp. KB1]|jgi:hypothetical protein|uniref:DUF1540 domain-containing protein n=1 Tax=Sporomusa sp. KB1 TaxID=943346 RepID=UPI00119F3F48|nr:DUF1540 domain-containing protein [Sporomusa sp. KB1]TWH44925.1 uncharacterized protein DUF1540 [Sporomusa sp. KB1]
MAKINCTVTSCSHNNSGICYANCVDIVGNSATEQSHTCCGSYLNKLHYSQLTSNVLNSGSCDCLKCAVETCIYNDNKLCRLDTIQVSGDKVEYHTQTECDSFKHRVS